MLAMSSFAFRIHTFVLKSNHFIEDGLLMFNFHDIMFNIFYSFFILILDINKPNFKG
jgi:hypothetical protein